MFEQTKSNEQLKEEREQAFAAANNLRASAEWKTIQKFIDMTIQKIEGQIFDGEFKDIAEVERLQDERKHFIYLRDLPDALFITMAPDEEEPSSDPYHTDADEARDEETGTDRQTTGRTLPV